MKTKTQDRMRCAGDDRRCSPVVPPAGGTTASQYPQQQYPPQQQQPPAQQQGMSKTSKGAIIGALAGVAAGLLSGDDATERRQRALVGAGVGGLAGGAIGNYQDRQEARAARADGRYRRRRGPRRRQHHPEHAQRHHLRLRQVEPASRSSIRCSTTSPRTLQEYNQTIVEVAGHTDSVGSDAYNQKLSEQRANSVSSYLTEPRPEPRPLHRGRRRRDPPGRQQRHRGRPRAEPPRRDHAGADRVVSGTCCGKGRLRAAFFLCHRHPGECRDPGRLCGKKLRLPRILSLEARPLFR